MISKINTKEQEEGFAVCKGLQSPLMFKGFKGRYIYIGAGFVMGGFIIASGIISAFGTIPGILVLGVIWTSGYIYISKAQKKGLHAKNNEKGIFIVVNKYKLRKLDEKESI